MSVERWPVHRLIAFSACPCGVPAAAAEAGLMANQHLARAEAVPVRAVGDGWFIHFPLDARTSCPCTLTSLFGGYRRKRRRSVAAPLRISRVWTPG